MGMRASDAVWLRREVLPFIEEVRSLPARDGRLSNWGLELISQVNDRIETAKHVPWDRDSDGVRLNPVSPGRSLVMVDDYPVPYLDVFEIDREREDDPVEYKIVIRAGSHEFATEEMTADDTYRTAWLLAQAMAISAGWTCHGRRSMPLNLHGPAVGMAPLFDAEPMVGELQVAEGWGVDTDEFADKVAQRLRVENVRYGPMAVQVDVHNEGGPPEPGTEKQWFETARFYAENADYWKAWYEQADRDAARLAAAIDLTRQYIGVDTLPDVEGWSWHDAMEEHERRVKIAPGASVEPPPSVPVEAPIEDSSECEHPQGAVFWNEFNAAIQCHSCGHRFGGEIVWPDGMYEQDEDRPPSVPHVVFAAPPLGRSPSSQPEWHVNPSGGSSLLTFPTTEGGLVQAIAVARALDCAAYDGQRHGSTRDESTGV